MTAPVDVATSAVGGHTVPPRFSSDVDAAPRRRRRRPGIAAGTVTVLVAAAAVGILQVAANVGYDGARDEFDAAASAARSSTATVRQELASLSSTVDAAELLKSADSGVLTAPDARDSLASATMNADEAAGPAESLLADSPPRAASKPSVFWELFAASGQLAADARDLDHLAADLDAATPPMTTADTEVTDAGVALLRSASEAAPAFESAHLSAKNDAVVALRDAASRASDTTILDASAVEVLVAMQDAAAEVVATEQAELAEKAGPLQGARLEIEAFARSLAPGVLLEFDWNQIVNNAGYNGSMGGLTRWWWDDPDRASIELSNSVAEQWPDERSKALIAHEVGHAISVKCEDMYDSSTQDSIEKWATAWAISMGFTDDANGVWAYGYPPQSYIDAASGCR
nr:hypothetical protein [Microbacterium hydrocarbonoxydans]